MKVESSKFKVQSSKFKGSKGSKFKVQSSKFQVPSSKFQVPSSKFKVQKFVSSSVRQFVLLLLFLLIPRSPPPRRPLPSLLPRGRARAEVRGRRSRSSSSWSSNRDIGARFFLPLLFIGTFSSSGTWERGGGCRGAVCTEGSCRNGRRKAEGGRVKLRGHSCPRPQDYSAHHTSRS